MDKENNKLLNKPKSLILKSPKKPRNFKISKKNPQNKTKSKRIVSIENFLSKKTFSRRNHVSDSLFIPTHQCKLKRIIRSFDCKE